MSTDEKLPVCEKCRRETVCVKVETSIGERTICWEFCYKLWIMLNNTLQRRVEDMLKEHHENFFDMPTRKDIPFRG